MTEIPVALIDDDDDLRDATRQLLDMAGHNVLTFHSAEPALAALDAHFPGVVVTDIRMPGMSGLELFRALSSRDAELPVILMTGHGDIDTAVATLKSGAWDFLTKPFDPDVLLAAVSRAGKARSLVIENRRLRLLAEAATAEELVGSSPAIRHVRATLPMLADADLDVVVEGATGTGKQLLARLIHREGRRAKHRFTVVDCAALPAAAEDALFDAYGTLSRAHRGTLFLDNLDRAGDRLQHRLAQFTELRTVAIDAGQPVPVNVRIVAAIDEGGRERVLPALFHRLAAVSLRLPPLAERLEDVPILAVHFLVAKRRGLDQQVTTPANLAHLALRRTWPGNVRELELAVERIALGLGDEVPPAKKMRLPDRMRAYERALIVEAIDAANGEVARVIDLLGIPRETFYYRVKRLGIELRTRREK